MKIFIRTLAITIITGLLIATATYFFINNNTKETEAAWYDSSWLYRKSLVIDADQVAGSSNFTNFPILVSRTDTDLRDSAQADADDILFTSSDGSTKLDHEIETYNSSTGELQAWVEIPTLDYDDDTTIYMYYGNASASSQQNATGVWGSEYQAVYHLADDYEDSSSNNRDGTNTGAVNATGKVSDGDDFENADATDNIALGTWSVSGNAITLSGWAKIESYVGGRDLRFLSKGSGTANHQFMFGTVDSGGNNVFRGRFGISSGTFTVTGSNLASDTWYYAAAVYDGSLGLNNIKIYLNGVLNNQAHNETSNLVTNSNAVEIGAQPADHTTATAMDGVLDEMRVISSARSADWLLTEYNNQNNPSTFFASIGSSQLSPGVKPETAFYLDEGYSTTAYNTGTENNGNGTISGALWRTEDLCIFSKCLYFDGSNDVVTVSGTTAGVKSVSFWVRPITTSEQLIDLNGTASISASSGTISGTSFTSPTIYVNGKVSSTLTANRWQHIVVTTGTGISASAIKLGQISTNYGQMFMDQVEFYSSQLSSAQVISLYNSRGGTPTNVQLGAYNQQTLSDGLVGYWKLDESSGNATDSSGNGTTLTNNSTTTFTGAKFGNSGEFDGTADYFEAADTATLSLTGDVTLAAWINNDDTTGSQNIIGKWDGTNNSYLLALEGDELRMYIDSTSNYQTTTTTNLSSNTFTHVAGVYNTTTQTVQLFVNGTLQTSSTTGTIPSSIGDDAGEIVIGADDSPANYFDGHIDDARIYNRALSGEEIQQLYNWAPSPVAHWSLDENTGSVTYDKSGNGNVSSTFTGNVTWGRGKYGSSLLFDGTGDVTRFVETTSTDLGAATDSYSVMGWINTTSGFGSNNTVLAKCNGTTGTICPFTLTKNGSGLGSFYIRDASTTSTASGGPTINDGEWHHLAGVRNAATDSVLLYVNGVLVSTVTDSTSGSLANNADLSIGGSGAADYLSVHLDGSADDLKIYNYARTPAQIIQDMNAGHPLVGTPVAGPVAHWSFDEGYDTTANDQTPNNNDLTLSEAGWSNNGKFGKAYDGASNRRLSRADDSDFDFDNGSDDFTISAWFNRGGAISNQEYLVDKHATNDGFTLYMDNDGDIVCGIGDGTSFPEDTAGTTAANYDDTSWHHAVCVKSGTSSLTLYIDGRQVAQDTSLGANADMSNSGTLYVGDTNATDGTDEWLGDLDEIKIYRAALSPSDVQLEYNQGKSLVLGSTGTSSSSGSTPDNSASREHCVPGDTSTCNPPTGYWNLNERTGTTANDTSTSSHPGTLTGSPSWTVGKIGGGVELDGTDDYINIPTYALSDFVTASAGAMSIWYKPKGSAPSVTNPYNGDLIIGDHSGFVGIYRSSTSAACDGTSGDYLYFYNWDGDADCVAVSYTADEWIHLSWVHSGGNLYAYKNGQLIGSVASGSTSTITGTLRFGSFGSTHWAQGTIDEIKTYNYARTASQVAWDYNKGKPIAHWQFDETSGTTAYDASGNNNNGTLTNSPTITTSGKINSALTFDGSNDYVNVPTSSSISITADITIAAWIKRGVTNQKGDILVRTNGSNWDYEFGIDDTGQDDKIFFYADAPSFFTQYSSGTISDTNWHHVAFTRSGSSTTLYIDGKQSGTSTASGAFNNNSTPVRIGGDGDTVYFNGTIDDARLYNYALTTEQIKTIMNDNAAIKFQ